MVPGGIYNAQIGIYYKSPRQVPRDPHGFMNTGITRPALSHV
jgi:hypothetical protein